MGLQELPFQVLDFLQLTLKFITLGICFTLVHGLQEFIDCIVSALFEQLVKVKVHLLFPLLIIKSQVLNQSCFTFKRWKEIICFELILQGILFSLLLKFGVVDERFIEMSKFRIFQFHDLFLVLCLH